MTMKSDMVRVRFAPSPTGLMHLGNIRTALMNYLFAQHYNGAFIVRIEDTDPSRNFDPDAQKIIKDLDWLSLSYDEGPVKNGPYAPYFQSERSGIHQEYLEKLISMNCVYRCFCTQEELEHRRQRQITMKQPPRYDRICTKLSTEEIASQVANKVPFIWRIKLDHTKKITISDLAHGTITFELKHFSDFPITRQDGSFTFMFANLVDDIGMKITHVLRGEDHLTNTAGQAALYDIFKVPLPTFWHMPVLCNMDGKKMSKRDFGFSLAELKDGGFLPEAINNYLAIIGGGSFEEEIMSLKELTHALNFDHVSTTGHAKYDLEKLTWVNHKWINRISPQELLAHCRPLLEHTFPAAAVIDNAKLSQILQTLKPGFNILKDCITEMNFYFAEPVISSTQLESIEQVDKVKMIATAALKVINDSNQFVQHLKSAHKEQGVPLKSIFQLVRLALMGSTKGPSIHELVDMLGAQEAQKRIEKVITE